MGLGVKMHLANQELRGLSSDRGGVDLFRNQECSLLASVTDSELVAVSANFWHLPRDRQLKLPQSDAAVEAYRMEAQTVPPPVGASEVKRLLRSTSLEPRSWRKIWAFRTVPS